MSGIDRTTCERDGAGDDGNKQQFFSQMPTYAVIGGGGMLLGGGAWAGYYRQKFRQKMGEVPLKRPSGSSVSVASKNRAHQLGFNPYTLAFRALGYGTLISVSAFVVGCTGIGWAMGVRDLKGFGDVMKVWVPEKLKEIGYRPPEYITKEKELLAGMSEAEERDYWLSFFKEEDET